MSYQINALQYFLTSAHAFPSRPCVNDRGTVFSYEEVLRRVQRLAATIQSKRLANEHPIAVFLDKGIDAIVAILACQYSRQVYVPIDVTTPAERLRAVFEQLGQCAVITNRSLKVGLADIGEGRDLFFVEQSGDDERCAPNLLYESSIDSNPLYVIFTSGSTGVPKGVTISHRSVIDYIEWARAEYQLDETDVMMSQAPLYFDNSTLDLYLTWASGACLFIPDPKVYSFPVQTLEVMRVAGVTTVFWVPSVLVSIANSGLLAKVKVDSLKRILFAGEPMPVSKINEWVDAYPGRLFSNLYGPTEITVDCTFFTFFERFEGENLPIGIPCRNTDILILGERDEIVADGEVGELCVRGSSLALGYWNDPVKTAAVFVQNPQNHRYRDLVYRTGDLAKKDHNGRILFLGRKDTQIKHMGYRIELGDIESALSVHDAIGSVCVLYSESKREIAAVYATKAGETVDVVELKRFCAGKLPRYMIPSRMVQLAELPLTANGKINRLALKAQVFGG